MRLPCFAPALAEIPRARQHGHPDTSPQDRRLRIWPAMTAFPLTRSDALARLAQFTPRAGSAYGARRNFVSADGDHDDVSRLSAALRRRVIGEDEVVRAVICGAIPLNVLIKFIAEVFWRTYWKGWLEARPGVWAQALEANLRCSKPTRPSRAAAWQRPSKAAPASPRSIMGARIGRNRIFAQLGQDAGRLDLDLHAGFALAVGCIVDI
jgi:deoxyribodipyrimidine photolyase